MKIYTRTGDQGQTSLFTGERVHKNHLYIEALGAVDEGNCHIGAALSLIDKIDSLSALKKQLELIQHTLFDVGAAIATPRNSAQSQKKEKTRFDEEGVKKLEEWMDSMELQLPPLKQFILPGGHSASSALHLARSVVRRAERAITPLFQQKEVTAVVLAYLNRLSDYLFMAARFLNHELMVKEIHWQPHQCA